MPSHRLRKDLRLIPLPGRHALIAGEFERVLVNGGSDPDVNTQAWCERLPSDTTAALERAGMLVADTESSVELPSSQAANWEASGIGMAEAARALSTTKVTIVTELPDIEEFLRALFSESGVESKQGDDDFKILAVADYLSHELVEVNDKALTSRHAWTVVKPLGQQLWVGPIFHPGVNACWACLRHRIVQNRWPDMRVWRSGEDVPPLSKASMPAHWRAAACVVASEVLRFLVTGASPLEDSLLTLDTRTWQSWFHPVERRRDCPACGGLGRPRLWGGSQPVATGSPIAFALRRHQSPITGFFHGLQEVEQGAWDPFHIVSATVVPPLNVRATFAERQPLMVSGCSTDPERAKLSCAAEAIERYSLFARGDECCIRASVETMGDRGVAISSLWQYSEGQYEQAADWNALGTPECSVPERLWPEHQIEWLEARDWTGKDTCYLPAGWALMNYVDYDASFAACESTGTAAAQTVEEALMRALLEVIERDAAAIWWYNRLRRPELEVTTPGTLQGVQDWFANRGRRIWILDLTSDWRVPVAAAVSARQDGSRILYATAAALTSADAALKAVQELVQLLYSETRLGACIKQHWLQSQTLQEHEWLLPDSESLRVDGLIENPTLEVLLSRARKKGLQVLSVDLSRAETAMRVLKVCVPGMRSSSRRLGPGRLYVLPVEMGWVAGPAEEEELNPWPFVL